jgi:hypothetical protein
MGIVLEAHFNRVPISVYGVVSNALKLSRLTFE